FLLEGQIIKELACITGVLDQTTAGNKSAMTTLRVETHSTQSNKVLYCASGNHFCLTRWILKADEVKNCRSLFMGKESPMRIFCSA
ncbi:hypothetical protein OS493_039880, partial [Desmophyllum pertusum]